MDKEQINTMLLLINAALLHGVPAVKKFIDNMNKDTITAKDMENLKIDKEWDSYFRR